MGVFFLDFICFWGLFFKSEEQDVKLRKLFSCIMIISAGFIPIINSSFFQPFFKGNMSYFEELWLWFILLGIVFITLGVKIHSLAFKAISGKKIDEEQLQLVKKKIYAIARHPTFLSWLFIFIGITFIMDSFIALLFCPILTACLELLGLFEEKYILIPKFGDSYIAYVKKTPNRLISHPYNYLLIILAIIVGYIGFINLGYIT